MEFFWSRDVVLCVTIHKSWTNSFNPAQTYCYFYKIQDGPRRHSVSPKII